MDFRKYVGRRVKVDLINSTIFYEGIVLEDTTETCLELKDRNGKFVSLKEESVANIREVVSNGY